MTGNSRTSSAVQATYIDQDSNPLIIDIELDVARIETAFDDQGETIVAANSDVPAAGESSNLSAGRKKRYLRYLLAAFFGLLIAWLPAVLFFKFAPEIYKSKWTIMIPGTTQGSSVNIDNLGEANTSTDSPYGGKSIDPKVNYKAIALSQTVLTDAAMRSNGMTRKEFGKPKINLVDQTTMIEVVSSADSAELAQLKSRSHYNALHAELDRLRQSERVNIHEGNQQQLAEYRSKVQITREALQVFLTNADIVSVEQYDRLIEQQSETINQRNEAAIAHGASVARVQALQSALGVTAFRAADILKLQQDLMFHAQLQAYAAAHANVVEKAAVLGARHPKVVHARARATQAYGSLRTRADAVLGYPSDDMLQQYLPNSDADSTSLYQTLILAQSELDAVESTMSSLDAMLPELQDTARKYAADAARLEELRREYQIANTILVSATTRLDLGKADVFASYPMTQLLVEPTVPEKPGRLRKLLVLLGAMTGSVLILLALVVLWNRKVWRQRIQKSA